MGKTAINWTNDTWNPLAGCDRISPGCSRCYARELHQMRYGKYLEGNGLWSNGKPIAKQYAVPFETVQMFPERVDNPRKWREGRFIFVNSVSDLFHKDVPIDFIQRVFNTMNETPRHTYQILTKRHERLAEIAAKGLVTWTPNIWQGVSIENNRFVVRADYLRIVPAYVRFISAEPLLTELSDIDLTDIHWVICGGESGPRYRPLNLDHARHLRDKCLSYDVDFWFKQIGGRKPDSNGRLLDGHEWNGMPELAGSEGE